MSAFNRYNDPDHFRGNYSIPDPTPAPTPAPASDASTSLGIANLIDESLLSVDEAPKKELGPLDVVLPSNNPGAPDIVFRLPDNVEDMINNGDLDGMTLYPIINAAKDLGPEAERILKNFTQSDVPFIDIIGTTFEERGLDNFFRPQDFGSATQETLFQAANFLEDWIARPVSGFVGELVGGTKGRIAARDFDFVPNRVEIAIGKAYQIPGVEIISSFQALDEEGEPIKDFSTDLAEIEAGMNKEAIESSLLGKPFENDPFAAATREALKDVKDKKPVEEGEDEIAEGEEGTEGADDDKTGGKDLSDTKPVGFFSSDKFLSAIRNVGKSLVEQGQFGSGLALGAVGFADEQAQRQLLAEQRQAEINQLILEASLKGQASLEPEDLKTLSNFEKNITQNSSDFQGGQVAIGFMDIIIEEIEKAPPGKIGGFQGWFDSTVQKISNLLGYDVPFADLAPQSKIEALAKVVQQGNLQAILGESGRTISDKDREIVVQVFGTPGLFDNRNTALELLRASRSKLINANVRRKNDIALDYNKISDPAFGYQGQVSALQLNPLIQLIQSLDPYSPSAATVGNLTSEIKTITLRPKD